MSTFEIVTHAHRTPKWVNRSTGEVKCCFCNNTYLPDQLSHVGHYVCDECDLKMRSKYQYGWWSFRFVNSPNWGGAPNIQYRPGLIDSLFQKHKIINEGFLHDLNKALSKVCPICQRYHTPRDYISKFFICKDCVKGLRGYDRYVESDAKTMVIDFCESHGFYVSTQPNGKLKTCELCSLDARVYCDECEWELSTSEAVKDYLRKEASPFTKTVNNIMLLPIDSYVDKAQWKINTNRTCSCCGRLYTAHNSTSSYCGRCFNIAECDGCGGKYLVKPSKYNRVIAAHGEWSGFCSTGCSSRYHGNKRWAEQGVDYQNVVCNNSRIELTPENAFEYENVQGVWYREDEHGELLQVSETMNIFREYANVQEIIDQIVSGQYQSHCSYKQMQNDGVDLSKTKTYILELTEDRKRRFDVEAHYAVTNRAKYWKPAPGYQTKMLYGKKVEAE